MQSMTAVRAIADPDRRIKAANRLVEEASAAADASRTERDVAATYLYRRGGWRQVDVMQEMGVSRALFNRMMKRAPAPLPEIADPIKSLRAASRRCARYDAIAVEARALRDAMMQAMLEGGEVDGVAMPRRSNSQIAKVTGLSTARVSQMFPQHGRETAPAPVLAGVGA